MARMARHKGTGASFYHLLNRVAGAPGYYPLQWSAVARKFLVLFEFYLRLYECRLASFELMGNHYHSVVKFEGFRRLEGEELERRARVRFGGCWREKTQGWEVEDWEQFNRDLFDVSKFMQHVNGEFAKWFNRRHGRRGHFWGGRFKNPELLDGEAVRRAILYSELNAVRARLVRRPEQYRMGSANWRWRGKKRDLLIPLEELFEGSTAEEAFRNYRGLLDCGGGFQGVIEESIVEWGEQRGMGCPGVFRRRLRFFTDGVALGGRRPVSRLLAEYRREGLYRRRRHPIPQLGGWMYSLREQRSHAFASG